MSGKVYNFFVVLLILAGAGALPAVADSQDAIITQVQFSSDSFKNAEFSDSRLVEIGRELSEWPAASVNSIGVKPLPAIPATFFMVLTGFVCVSLVKDRRLWLTAAFGVLYLGAAGIHAIPQLLPDPKKIKIKHSSPKGAIFELKNLIGPQCEAQVTRYIGLLHRMSATAGSDSFAENNGGKSIKAHLSKILRDRFLRLAPAEERLYLYLSAIRASSCNSQFSLAYLVMRTQSWVCLSQAFTAFNCLPHGPPEVA